MKKEKTIRTYQRKTKSGKITTVKSHTAKYDAAAEVAKKAARKKGAGGELQAKITKMPDPKLELEQYLDELKKSRSGASSDTAKTTKPAPKKKLKKPVGGGGITGLEPKKKSTSSKDTGRKKDIVVSKATAKEKKSSWTKTSDTPLRKKGDMAVGSMNVGKRSIDLEVRPTDKGYEVSMYDRKGNIGHLANIHIKTLSDLSKHVKSEVDPKRKLTSKLMDSGEIEYGTVRVKSKKLKSQEV